MSLGGPSALGTLLISRLDAALGVTLSQQTNLAAGARPDAVSQTTPSERVNPIDGAAQRHPQENIDRLLAQTRPPDKSPSSLQRKTRHPGALPAAGQLDGRTTRASARQPLPSATATASAPTSLGTAAQIILALLGRYPEPAAPVAGRMPLVQHAPAASPSARTPAAAAPPEAAATARSHASSQLLSALRDALKNSGLFYESHLARLSTGRHALAELMHEPQAQLDAKMPAQDHAAAAPGIHPATQLMVRQQLEAFGYQRVDWQGEAWPHTPMTLAIQRGHDETPGEPASHWATRLTVQLPCLGSIEARLTLADQQLALLLVTPDGSGPLAAGSADLRQKLSAQQITLSAFAVTATPPDAPVTHASEADHS